MKKLLLSFVFLILCGIQQLKAQDTFSIVAVDTVNGWVGSAGASCLDKSNIAGGASIISDVIPGRGAINTQALWRAYNQKSARDRMNAGDSPKQIINFVTINDVDGDSTVRQYGVVDYDVNKTPRVAGFTGTACSDYKNHIAGRYYCIQGNILLGQQILDSMQARFLRTKGSLPDKLMAALQGAKVVGADTRCMPKGVSSLSAFIKVAKPTDTYGKNYMNIIVDKSRAGYDPIDSLQKLYDVWQPAAIQKIESSEINVSVYPNPSNTFTTLTIENAQQYGKLEVVFYDVLGKIAYSGYYNNKMIINSNEWQAGMYFYQVLQDHKPIKTGKLILQ